jgi:hypothetical protein
MEIELPRAPQSVIEAREPIFKKDLKDMELPKLP